MTREQLRKKAQTAAERTIDNIYATVIGISSDEALILDIAERLLFDSVGVERSWNGYRVTHNAADRLRDAYAKAAQAISEKIATMILTPEMQDAAAAKLVKSKDVRTAVVEAFEEDVARQVQKRVADIAARKMLDYPAFVDEIVEAVIQKHNLFDGAFDGAFDGLSASITPEEK